MARRKGDGMARGKSLDRDDVIRRFFSRWPVQGMSVEEAARPETQGRVLAALDYIDLTLGGDMMAAIMRVHMDEMRMCRDYDNHTGVWFTMAPYELSMFTSMGRHSFGIPGGFWDFYYSGRGYHMQCMFPCPEFAAHDFISAWNMWEKHKDEWAAKRKDEWAAERKLYL